ncbi:tripartite tricarboxylate transporter TctB family protein [Pelagibius sp.]|uniref:tripartite tricarboxylate transporter TctB family protein n=1 Tax=Pelagibius sp. TaxID=1931238 RepID=UPI003B50DDCC
MDKGDSRIADLLAAALALGLGVFALSRTGEMSELGAVFPRTAAILLILAALGLALRSLLRRRSTAPEAAEPAPSQSASEGPAVSTEVLEAPRVDRPRLAGIALTLLAWALLLKPLGFLVTAAVGLVAVGLVTYRERMSLTAALLHVLAGAVLVGGFYSLFVWVLKIAVP